MWGNVKPMSGTEIVKSGRTVEQISHEIQIRYLPDMTTGKRIVFGTRTFNIESVTNTEERNRELILLVKERP